MAENVHPSAITVTGNTVIDALLWASSGAHGYGDPALSGLDADPAPVLLVTAHRRESWGRPMREAARALATVAVAHPELRVVFPMHANPLVREAVLPAVGHLPNVTVTGPLPYGGFARLMNRASLILTDSGGVQEEGPSLGKPVLVMRDTTERPEAVRAGTVRLVGTDHDLIVKATNQLLTDPAAYAAMAGAVNPYRDGRASLVIMIWCMAAAPAGRIRAPETWSPALTSQRGVHAAAWAGPSHPVTSRPGTRRRRRAPGCGRARSPRGHRAAGGFARPVASSA